MGEDTSVAGRGSPRRSAVAIDSERPSTSCCNLVTVKLRYLPRRWMFFTNSSSVTSKTGHVLSLLQTSVLCLVVLTANICALVVFISILQQRSTEAQKRLLCHCIFSLKRKESKK